MTDERRGRGDVHGMGERRGMDEVREALAAHEGPRIDLVVGTPCFDPPRELTAALVRAAGERTWGYSAIGGTPALREVLARRHGVESGQVFVGHGSKGALLALLGVLLRPGDEVVVPTPSYEAYRTMPTRFGARVVPVPRAEPGFPYDPAAIVAALTPRTRAVVLSSPCNPTGAVLSDEARAELLAAARERGIRVILDLAYDGFRFDRAAGGTGESPGSRTGAAASGADPEAGAGTLVELHTASKNLGVCGWRIGWVIADPALVQALAGFQSAHLNPPNTVTQVALESMPDVPTAFFRAARDAVRARVDALHASLIAAGWPATSPAGGFYVFADARDLMRALGIADTRELCVRLATRIGVGLTPGSDFGQEGWVRASAVGLDDPARAAELAARLLRFATAR